MSYESRSPDGDGPLRARNPEHYNAADDQMNGRSAEETPLTEATSRAVGGCGLATPGAGSEPADSHHQFDGSSKGSEPAPSPLRESRESPSVAPVDSLLPDPVPPRA